MSITGSDNFRSCVFVSMVTGSGGEGFFFQGRVYERETAGAVGRW